MVLNQRPNRGTSFEPYGICIAFNRNCEWIRYVAVHGYLIRRIVDLNYVYGEGTRQPAFQQYADAGQAGGPFERTKSDKDIGRNVE